jgi:hypothetical protein
MMISPFALVIGGIILAGGIAVFILIYFLVNGDDG